MTHQYRIAEFAKLGGVTVRTLQYYDRLDLLKPSATTESGHRLYVAADLLRLQQIVTLKWMGFSLAQIQTILSSPTYDLRQALTAQKAAVDTQIERLRTASEALQTAMEATRAHDSDTLDAETVRAIIRGVTHQGAMMDTYYSETAQAGIALRGMAYSPTQMADVQEQWQAIYAGFEALLNQPLDHPDVVRMAAQMDDLIQAFTGGDPETESSLKRLVKNAEAGKLPEAPHVQAHFAAVDNDLKQFMQQALQHYRESQKGKTKHE